MERLFRKDLRDFINYDVVEYENKILLNANESFINVGEILKKDFEEVLEGFHFNRYPSSQGFKLLETYSNYCGVPMKNLLIGNGSDELIAIICTTFLNEGDRLIKLNPDFSMYSVYGKVRGAQVINYELDQDFKFDVEDLISEINRTKAKAVFLSVPNNPTGQVVSRENLVKLITSVEAIVVVDEAYYEFYGQTIIDLVEDMTNLIILRTGSKIGLASLRIGFLATNKLLMEEIKKCKPPYNVNSFTQEIAAVFYKNPDIIADIIREIREEREWLSKELVILSEKYSIKVYRSEANFILVKLAEAEQLYKRLLEKDIVVRYFGEGRLKGYMRITPGSREENVRFIKEAFALLEEIDYEKH